MTPNVYVATKIIAQNFNGPNYLKSGEMDYYVAKNTYSSLDA